MGASSFVMGGAALLPLDDCSFWNYPADLHPHEKKYIQEVAKKLAKQMPEHPHKKGLVRSCLEPMEILHREKLKGEYKITYKNPSGKMVVIGRRKGRISAQIG